LIARSISRDHVRCERAKAVPLDLERVVGMIERGWSSPDRETLESRRRHSLKIIEIPRDPILLFASDDERVLRCTIAFSKMPDTLTAYQRKLQKELAEIAEIVRIDYWNIHKWERVARTTVLEVMRRELIRGEVVGQYTLIDDLLSTQLCKYFLPGKNLILQWKTKRFRRFNYYVIERLFLTQKLAFLKDVYRVPKNIASSIEEINSLRNAMAHAFFPENLRAYQMKGRPAPRKPIPVRYKGVDIFSAAGAKRFVQDCAEVTDFLTWKLKRKKESKVLLFGVGHAGPSPTQTP